MFLLILVCSNVLVYQLTLLSTSGSSSSTTLLQPQHSVGDEKQPAVALPSLAKATTDTTTVDRKFYGGAGDAHHLGGFTLLDTDGLSPAIWKDMLQYLGIHTLLDVGCGKGISTLWFQLQGMDATCVEGSQDALQQSVLSQDTVVAHDFARGPWYPTRTVDAIWCVEFLEHVGRNYMHHYLPTLERAAMLFVTSSQWGGWHHVEVHFEGWWRAKMESFGFVYSEYLTQRYRKMAFEETYQRKLFLSVNDTKGALGKDDRYVMGAHMMRSLQVYINPPVARLPRHVHLLAEPGCVQRSLPFKNNTMNMPEADESTWNLIRRTCGAGKSHEETLLPKEFEPLPFSPQQEEEWRDRVLQHVLQQAEKSAKGT